MSPRRGRTGTVLRVRFVVLAVARVRRASWEITRPAVDFSFVASSLAAWRTSSSISSVVRMHLMLSHRPGYVKPRPRLCLFTLSVLLLSNCGVTRDQKLIRRRHNIARRNTAAFSRARARAQRLSRRLFRRARWHSGTARRGGGNERLSVSPQRQYALGLSDQRGNRRDYRFCPERAG